MDNKLYLKDSIILNFKIHFIPLVIPHIGQGILNICLNKQTGLKNKMISRSIIPLIIKVFIILLFT